MAMDIGSLVGYLELDTDKWEGPLAKVGGKMPGWMASAGAAGALALGAAFGATLTNAINIDAANDKIAAQLGLTEEEGARAGQAAADAYAGNFGESLEAVQSTTAGVISSIHGMRDASVEDLSSIVSKVQTLADGFGIEADRISQVVGQMLSTGMAASAEEGLDLLTAALQKVPAAVREDILDATDEYGPFFAAVGMSGEEAMGALVAASEKGMYGIDKTGDAVKEFGIRATDMSAASVAAYEAAGLNAEEMSAKILAGGDTAGEGFQQIIDGLLAIEDPVARANAAIGLFGTPLEDLGVNEIPTFLAGLQDVEGGLGDVSGAAGTMAATAGDNVASNLESMRRQFEMVTTELVANLLPALQPIAEWLAANPAAVQAFALVLGVLALAFVGLSIATWASNAAFLASPITWIIIGILALVAALVWLVANWDMVAAWITEVWAGFIGWITGVMDGFVGWWNDLWATVGQWISDTWSGFVGFVTDTWNGFVSWLTGITDGVASWWNGLWASVGQFISDTWNGFVSAVTGVWNGFTGMLHSTGQAVASWWNGLWSGIGSFISGTWNGFIGFVQGVFGAWVSWLRGIGDGVASWWNGLWGGINSFFQGLWSGLVSWATGLVSGWLGGWRGAFGALTGFFSGLWSGIAGTVSSTWEGVMSFLGSIPGRIKGFFSGIGTWLLDSGKALIQGFIDGISGMLGGVGDAVGGIMDFVGGFFPHSPAKRGPFSGAGWLAVAGGGEALMDEFARGMHMIDPFAGGDINAIMDLPSVGPTMDDAPAPRGDTTFVYNAAENQSLSSEEAVFAALGSPRSPFGGEA